MRQFTSVFRMQLRYLLCRRRTGLLFLLMAVIVTLAVAESGLRYYGAELSSVPSAAGGWIGRAPKGGGSFFNLYVFVSFSRYLVLPIGALVFADSYLTDLKEGPYLAILTRSSSSAYRLSGALLAFVGGFAVIFIPLLISFCLSFLMFPIESTVNPQNSGWSLLMVQKIKPGRILFAPLFFQHPYLTNLVYICYDSLLAACWALASYALGYLVRISRLLVVVIPTVFVILVGEALDYFQGGLSFDAYVNPIWQSDPRYTSVFFAYLVIPLLFFAAVMLPLFRQRKADEL
ncbi:MAG: hypothetical protein E6593_14435 [Clostridium sp.]|nr:hypothetical protein [Clostridium sp.]